jgi:branched-chain amino acid transport system ATP-binding protein
MSPEHAVPFLSAENIVTGYGKREVLKGVDINIYIGEIVALVGHNGAGKSTLVKAIFGLISLWKGQVILEGQLLQAPTPRRMLKAGIAYVPQGNRVFVDLSVRDNLELAGVTLGSKALVKDRIEHVFDLFPMLKPRMKQRAGTLSGGEKQMLALGNALVLSPRMLLLDEPSLGLAPTLVSSALSKIQRLSQESNVTVLIVEQKVREVLKIAQRVYALRTGFVSFSGLASELEDEEKLRQVYL